LTAKGELSFVLKVGGTASEGGSATDPGDRWDTWETAVVLSWTRCLLGAGFIFGTYLVPWPFIVW